MDNLIKFSKKFITKNVKAHEIIFTLLLLLYILSGVSTPINIVPYINTYLFYIIAIFVSIIVFISVNPFIGILFALSFYILSVRTKNMDHLESSEKSKSIVMSELNELSMPFNIIENNKGEVIANRNDSNILEVEVVKEMVVSSNKPSVGEGAYEPVQAGGVNSTEL